MSEDSRIKLFLIDNEGVISRSRNLGVRHSRGKLIAFIDSDDTWHPDKLLLSVQAMSCSVSITYHDMYIVSQSTTEKPLNLLCSSKSPPKLTFRDLLANGNSIINSSVVVKSSVLSSVQGISEDRSLVGAEDYHTWLKLLKAGCEARKLHGVLGTIAIRQDAMTTPLREYLYTKTILEYFLRDLNNTLPAWAIRKILSYQVSNPRPLTDLATWGNYVVGQPTLLSAIRLVFQIIKCGSIILISRAYACIPSFRV